MGIVNIFYLVSSNIQQSELHQWPHLPMSSSIAPTVAPTVVAIAQYPQHSRLNQADEHLSPLQQTTAIRRFAGQSSLRVLDTSASLTAISVSHAYMSTAITPRLCPQT